MRWVHLALLVGLAFFASVQRTGANIISAPLIAQGMTQMQIGWVLTSFLVSYAVFQFPGGMFGEWLGARHALTSITLLAILSTTGIVLAPSLLSGGSLFIGLLCAYCMLGIAQAPFFPIASGVIEAWFPSGRWGTPQGILSAGALAGSCAAAPLTAWLIETEGWGAALALPSIAGLGLVAYWAWYARNDPASHRGVSSTELAELDAEQRARTKARVTTAEMIQVVRNRHVLLLALSYLSMNFVFFLLSFWSFLYLVQERHFSILEGGWLASIPYAAAAAGGLLGGVACDHLCQRFGARQGFRMIPLVALPIAGLLLLAAVYAINAYWAVAGLALAYGSIELTEGPFLAATTTIARQHAMAAGAIVNTGGNIGGIIATPLVAFLSAKAGWTTAFITGSVFAMVSAGLWLLIDASQSIAHPEPVKCNNEDVAAISRRAHAGAS